MQPHIPGTQSLRFRKPTNQAQSAADEATIQAAVKLRASKETQTAGPLLQEILRRNNPPWAPNFSTAFRLLILVRFSAAMYTFISDCDETYNYWEPLHYLVKNTGFQTWEYSPAYAIRSWAYILIHAFPPWLANLTFSLDKRPAFFSVRILLAFMSTLCECRMYRSIVQHISIRAGRYFLFFLLFNAGMWNAATSFLPSTSALHLVTLGMSFALEPPTGQSSTRVWSATTCFVVAALLGWPFAGLLAVPFALEELTLSGNEPSLTMNASATRFNRLFAIGLTAVVGVSVPLLVIDRAAYGKWIYVPWQIVSYNVLAKEGGPELYGTEPWTFYPVNLALNFNILLPLAIASLPLVFASSTLEPLRFGIKARALKSQTSAAKLLAVRLAPMYLWLLVVGAQPHKEERFMFPIYTLMCFAAALSLALVRGTMEAFYVKVTSSPYRAGRTVLFPTYTGILIFVTTAISASRILAMQNYYKAPFTTLFHFQYNELPVRAVTTHPEAYTYLKLNSNTSILKAIDDSTETFDLSSLKYDNVTLCLGQDWYRFPTHWLIPDGIQVAFLESETFNGILPKYFDNTRQRDGKGRGLLSRSGTSRGGSRFNNLNRAEPDQYVSLNVCHYVMESHFPDRDHQQDDKSTVAVVPSYISDTSTWDKRYCTPFLDASHSSRWTRAFWMPGQAWQSHNAWGEMCLFTRKP